MFSKSKAWAVGLLVAVAAAGFAAGVAVDGWLLRRGRQDGYAGYLTRELKLSDAQHDSVVAILRRHRPEMRALYATIRPQMDSVRARVADEIRLTLTPTQQPLYQQMLDRDRAERARADSGTAAQVRHP